MKYRTKLYLILVAIAFLSTFVGIAIVYTETSTLVYKILQSRVKSIAATTAALLDADALQKIHSTNGQDPTAYQKIQNQLLKAQNVNRRTDVYVTRIYTLFPSPDRKELFISVNSESHKEGSSYGNPYKGFDEEEILKFLDTYYAPNVLSKIPEGVGLSGYAPVYDPQKNYIGTVGVDIRASETMGRLEQLIDFGIVSLLVSLCLALIIGFFLSRQVTVSLSELCDDVKEIGKGNFEHKTHLKTHDEFSELGEAINDMALGLKEREKLKMSFARYVSTHVLDKILQSETPMKLEGERKKVTILFSDIRQFTPIAEKLSPEEVVSLLNEYFATMLDVIFKNQGTLDKFIGDGIMVEFGAPLEDELQEKHAISTALEMQETLKRLCDKWIVEGKPSIQIGIGIHTGFAVVGNIGSEQRMEYTAVGDTVNIASKLEQATKIVKKPILISEAVFLNAKNDFIVENLGPMTLPGRSEPIIVYAIIGKQEKK